MPHSYSEYSTYKQCAAKHNYAYNMDFPRVPIGPAGQRGTQVHDTVEQFMLGKTDQLDKSIHEKYGQWLYGMRNNYECIPELRFSFDVHWNPVPWDDEDCFVRGFFDLHVDADGEIIIYEWKTGKVYDTHVDQRFLYGFIGLLLHEDRKEITVHGVYFDQKENPPVEVYRRVNINFMKQEWQARFSQIEQDEIHAPNPSFLCKYCQFSKSNNGPCQF